MRPGGCKPLPLISACLLTFLFGGALVAAPALAQEGVTGMADQPVGTAFRWLNFALVFGGIGYLAVKFGGPYFRGQAQSVSNAIAEAAAARAAAERELGEAGARLARVDGKVRELRQAAQSESAAEAERIRALTRSETEKIAQAGRAEIEAAERAARQELRAIAARVATERAAALLRARLNAQAEAALFHSFVGELERSAP